MDPLAIEQLIIAIGLDNILAGNPRYGVGVQEEADKMSTRIRGDVLSFMNGGDGEPKAVDFSYPDVLDQLTDQADDEGDALSQRNLDALYAKLPPELADAVNMAATPIVLALSGMLPRRVSRSSVKLTVGEPAPEALHRFKRQWTAAVDPLSIVRDPMSANPTTVAAVAQFYPELYEGVIKPAVDEAIATLRTRRGENWDLDFARNRAIKVLVGAPSVNLDLAADFEKARPQPQPPPPSSAATVKQEQKTTEAETLASQR